MCLNVVFNSPIAAPNAKHPRPSDTGPKPTGSKGGVSSNGSAAEGATKRWAASDRTGCPGSLTTEPESRLIGVVAERA